MQKTLMKIINELMKMKDDEKFCKAEYDAVQDYCCKKDFQLSKEERKIIHDIGLEKRYHGKKVCNMEWYCGIGALEIGDLVDASIVDQIINCLPPACMRSDCTQLGEPTDHRMDKGQLKPVFATFRKVEDNIWKFCGSCFQGENVER